MDTNALLPAPAACRIAGIYRQLLYAWRTRGHITPAATDHRGQPLYRLGDILAVEATMRGRTRR